MHQIEPVDTFQDGFFAGSLIASPAWVPLLSHLNMLLTTLTLILGIALAAARIWQIVKADRSKRSNP